MLEGALVPPQKGLPLGTEFYLITSEFNVVGGESFTVTTPARNDSSTTQTGAMARLNLPKSWKVGGSSRLDDTDRAASRANGYLLVGFQAANGGTDSEAARIR